MKRIVVLGGYGIIGKIVVYDLFKTNKNCEIFVVGRNLEKAEEYANSFNSPRVKAKKTNIQNKKELVSLIKGSDVVVNCVQYYFNFEIMKACLKAKTNYVDLGGLYHLTKKQLKLHRYFKKIKKLAILGCGSSPGITNVLVAYGSKLLKKINEIEIFFADKDETKYEQKFVLPYSFKTLVDEFTLKPAVLKKGKIRFVKPMSGEKIYYIDGFGKKRAFLTLHSELATLPSFLKDKGIKDIEFRVTFDDDFIEKIKILIENGFTSKENLNLSGQKLKIIDVTSNLMEKFIVNQKTKIKDKEILRVIFNKGSLFLDAITKTTRNISAGSYNTGVPCSIITQMISENKGLLKKSGVYAPESIINPKEFFSELKKRGIIILKNKKRVN
ncbi:MAG: saccharopine dehydrogenase [Candidatus Pacearchaeota archaeon]|nr:MAG: saccharopine dehydrogenase [Candidatus Pacearchaeota archaeon]